MRVYIYVSNSGRNMHNTEFGLHIERLKKGVNASGQIIKGLNYSL